jgi:hypothetical protein
VRLSAFSEVNPFVSIIVGSLTLCNSQVKENFPYATAALILKRRPKTVLLKLGMFSVVPNYMALLAFMSPPEAFVERVRTLLTLFLALTGGCALIHLATKS